jgi:hypothetical protein
LLFEERAAATRSAPQPTSPAKQPAA